MVSRILFVQSRLSLAGGAEWIGIESALKCVDKGILVDFICQEIEDEELKRLMLKKGIKVTELGGIKKGLHAKSDSKSNLQKLVTQFFDVFNFLVFIRIFTTLFFRKRYDLVHVHKIRGMSPLVFFSFYVFSKKVLYTSHDYELYSYNAKKLECLASRLYFYFLRYIYTLSLHKIIFPSRFVKNKVVEVYPCLKEKSVVVSNFVDPPLVSPVNSGIDICYVGRLEGIKGIDKLLAAYNVLNIPNKIHVVGDGSLYKRLELKYRTNKKIIFYGNLGSKKRDQVLKKCSYLVVPSLWDEFFGLTALEGIVRGKAVLVSSCGALPEVVENYKNTYIVDSKVIEDITLFSEKLLFLVNNFNSINGRDYSFCYFDRYFDEILSL